MKRLLFVKKQVTITIKHDTGWIVRIVTEIEQTAEHHWYDVFMRYVPSANGILNLMLQPMIIVLSCCILLVLLLICFYIHVYHISCHTVCITSCYPIWTYVCAQIFPPPSPPVRQVEEQYLRLSQQWGGWVFGLWQGASVNVHSALVLASHTVLVMAWRAGAAMGHSGSNVWAGHSDRR